MLHAVVPYHTGARVGPVAEHPYPVSAVKRSSSSCGNPWGNVGSGSALTSPAISQWPMVVSLPALASRRRAKLPKGEAHRAPHLTPWMLNSPNAASVPPAERRIGRHRCQRVGARIAKLFGVRLGPDAKTVQNNQKKHVLPWIFPLSDGQLCCRVVLAILEKERTFLNTATLYPNLRKK